MASFDGGPGSKLECIALQDALRLWRARQGHQGSTHSPQLPAQDSQACNGAGDDWIATLLHGDGCQIHQ